MIWMLAYGKGTRGMARIVGSDPARGRAALPSRSVVCAAHGLTWDLRHYELHGAPLRLRNELELGFKQVKWIEAIEFADSFRHLGAGQGGYNEDHEFYGYRDAI
jgi:Oxidoreductase molybdopterin binding domain